VNALLLAECQSKFWSALNKTDSEILEFVCGDKGFDASSRLDVYRTTARSVHVSVLSSIYPVCHKILGDDYFKLIAKKYFIAYPSTNPDLNDYGEYFARYIAELIDQRYELSEFLYLSDLVKLEWSIHQAYYCQNNLPFDMHKFQYQCEQYQGEVKIGLAHGIELLKSQYPISLIWQQHQQDVGLNEIEAIKQDELICVYRENFQATYELVDEHVYKLMSAVQRNLTLLEVAELFDDSEELNSALAYCMNKQWLRI